MRLLLCVYLVLFSIENIFAEEKLPQKIDHEFAGKMVLIPSGEFMMGSTKDDSTAAPYEFPQHKVKISQPFYMGIHEVTFMQFRRFVSDSDYLTEAEKDNKGGWGYDSKLRAFVLPAASTYSWRKTGYKQDPDFPVVNVTWRDATAYCQWLTKLEKDYRFRLPTEAEWEYSCRAGTDTLWSIGNDPYGLMKTDNIADLSVKAIVSETRPEYKRAESWNDGNAFPSSVGSYEPNPFGLYDMHGNVTEWCMDVFSEDRYLKADNFKEVVGETRVTRGGNWIYNATSARSATRRGWSASMRSVNLGFRVVRETVPISESEYNKPQLALVPLYRFYHPALRQYYYSYGTTEIKNLRRRPEIKGETLIGYVSVRDAPNTIRLWRYELPNRKQYFSHIVRGTANTKLGKDLREWLNKGNGPVDAYRIWVWSSPSIKKLVPVYASSMPDGTNMLLTRSKAEIIKSNTNTRNSLGVKRQNFGVAFYVFKDNPAK